MKSLKALQSTFSSFQDRPTKVSDLLLHYSVLCWLRRTFVCHREERYPVLHTMVTVLFGGTTMLPGWNIPLHVPVGALLCTPGIRVPSSTPTEVPRFFLVASSG